MKIPLARIVAVVVVALVVAFGLGQLRGYFKGASSAVAKIEKKGNKDVAKADRARAAVDREPRGVCVRDPWCRRAD